MSDGADTRNPRLIAFAVLGVLVVVGGLGLAFFGVGSELSESRDVMLTVKATELENAVAEMVAVGDPVFTDAGGMQVGEISEVEVSPFIMPVPDYEGVLHPAEDPTQSEVIVTIEARGREGDGIVAIDNQVIQAGMQFNVITNRYVLRGTVVGVDVR